jgi:hypothetical protein
MVVAYAEAAGEEVRERLDKDPLAYLEVFDRLAAARQPAPKIPTRDIEAIIAAKEARKDSLGVLNAGVAPVRHTPDRRGKVVETLKRQIRNDPTNTDLQVALAKQYISSDD